MAHDEDLRRQVERLERRLARLETLLDVEGTEPAAEAPAHEQTFEHQPLPAPSVIPPLVPPRLIPASIPPLVEQPVDENTPAPRPPAPPTTAPPSVPAEEPLAPEPVVHAPRVVQAPPVTPPPVVPAPPAAPPVRRRPAAKGRDPLELLVGGKWMAWFGAFAVVIGVGFFLKYAYDQAWYLRLSETARCLVGAAFGGVLILCGELALRRISKPASVGCFAAGLSTLYLVAWAAFGRFDLISKETSFLWMGVVALGGFAITYRTRFRTIGVLSLIGGYATPILLRGATAHDLELLLFLTMLLVIALGLSAFLPKEFRLLRYVALGGQSLIALGWSIGDDGTHWLMGIFFFGLWWAMVLAESTVAALRRQSATGNVVATLLATAFYVTGGAWILYANRILIGFDWMGPFTAAIAVLGVAVAFQFGPGLAALRSAAKSAMDKLTVALWAQSGVLLAVAVALQFDDYGQSIGWLAIALASVEMARRLPSRGVGVFGLLVLALALGRVAFWDSWASTALQGELLSAGELTLTGWGLLGLFSVASVHVAARRLGVPTAAPSSFVPWKVFPVILAALGTFGYLGLAALQCRGLTVTGAWLVAPLVLLAVERWGRKLGYLEIGLAALIMTGGRWLLYDAVLGRAQPGWNPAASLPLLNGQMALALAIAATGWWAFSILRKRGSFGSGLTPVAQLILILGTVFLLIALSFETDRAVSRLASASEMRWSLTQVRQLMLTLLWSLGGFGLAALARVIVGAAPDRRTAPPRILFGFIWSVLGLCAVKWVVLDTFVLAWAAPTRPLAGAFLPLLNVQMLVGTVLAAASTMLVPMTAPLLSGESHRVTRWTGWVPVAAWVVVLWGLSFEVDRILARWFDATTPWPPLQLRLLWWTGLWAAGGLVMLMIGRRRSIGPMLLSGWGAIVVMAVIWLSADTLGYRLAYGTEAVRPIFNVQFGIGLFTAALLAYGVREFVALRGQGTLSEPQLRPIIGLSLFMLGAMGLWLGSLEIDRAIRQPMTVQTCLSVYWCLYGVALVILGFLRRVAIARYLGLGLLAVTALKVFIVDLSQVETQWRIVSFLALGLLLIGTSVLYAKLSPLLLDAQNDGPPATGPDA